MTADLAISVQRSLLAADALAERLLPEYDLPAGATCHFWHQSINDIYLVRAGSNRLMLRVAPANRRSREQLLAELDLLRYLMTVGADRPIRPQCWTLLRIVAGARSALRQG